jgi:hypothetical protein
VGPTSRPALAQAVYGSIAGTVLDSTGAAVPGATVTITSSERATSDFVVTSASGLFLKERLLPGRYEVKVGLEGFKTQVVPRVIVSVDTQTPLAIRLEPGSITESITVVSTAGQLLKTDRADVATLFDEKEVTELPVIDRNFTKFLLLTPGTQQMTWNHAASENPQGSTQTIVNGQTFSGTGWQLDGTDNRDVILGIIVINPNLEAIGETKITSQNYDAEFGQAVAGVVSVQTKSGGNELHGSAFEFAQRDRFQARNPFSQPDVVDPLTGRVLPRTQKDQFGASLGGPIVKDKFFWFADYQGSRNTVGGSRLLTVPTAAARGGDLSAYGIDVYDPATGDPSRRRQFPGNVIPASRLSPQAQAILSLLPLPNAPGRDNGTRDNYVAQGSEKFDADAADVRLDGRVSPSFNIFGRYSYARYSLDGPTSFGTGGGAELVSLGGDSRVKNQSVAAGFDLTIDRSTVLDLRFGYFRYKVDVLPFDYGTSPAADAGIPGLNLDDTFTSGLPALFINGDRGFAMGSGLGVNRCNCPLAQDESQWQVVSNLTKLLGRHTVKLGFDIRRAYNLRVPSDNHRSGELSFNPERTIGPDGGGMGLATFLLGDVSYFSRFVSTSTDARERQWRQFYYVQDTWRPSSRLTLSYGLRADIYNPQTVNAPGNGGWLDIDTGEIRVGGVGSVDRAGNVKNAVNWAPRAGVSYQINEKTVVRAGYGRSYDTGVFGSIFGHTVTQNLPVLAAQQINAPNNFDAVFNLAQGPTAPTFITPGSDGRFELPNGVFTSLLLDKQKVPALDAWNVSVQRQLSSALSVELAYVGNHSSRAFIGDAPNADYNQATIEGFGTLNYNERQPFFIGPPNAPYGAPYGWTQGIGYFCNCGRTDYQSLQAKVERRFSRGWSFLAHYTFQKAKQNDGNYFFIDPTLSYGPQQFGRDHNFVFSLLGELPFGRGRKWGTDLSGLANAVVGNWQVNLTGYVQSGTPFDVSYAGAGADRDTGPNRPDLIGDPNGPRTQEEWFNATPIGSSGSAFGRPAAGTFGDMPFRMLRGPGYWRVDGSVFKRFPFKGRSAVEFRLEVYNLFNHVNLGNPNSEVGTPTDPRPDAGRITSTVFPLDQRNLQFALRVQF